MSFQFLEDFPNLSVSCPPSTYTAQKIEAFRWVHTDMNNFKNFTPRYYLAPKRDLERIAKIENKKEQNKQLCNMLALSMFETEKKAKERFDALKQIMGKNIFKHLGTHIAKGCLEIEDGVNSPFDTNGHFEHHPISIEKYYNKFNKVSRL